MVNTLNPLHWLPAGKRRLGLVTIEASTSAAASNRVWLEDVSVLLLCVLALDRFADYGADQVRESREHVS